MTDNEIIKGLECCLLTYGKKCEECPYEKLKPFAISTKTCGDEMRKDVLDLINRQKAEIAELEAEIDKQYEQAKADIIGNMADGGTSCHWCIYQHKAEAVKEFAERLKMDVTINNTDDGYLDYAVDYNCLMEDIDNLVKEMVGEG